jgi:bifunctional non-homologous end joining protein LigD
MSPDDALSPYNAKRDFTKTAEPSGKLRKAKPKALRFCVQKHDATRLHFDFRLELDGVLKSWAVTRGPSTDPADKRLAVRVEDHPFDYRDFEGTIPAGEYGGGTVMLWDEGTWEPVGDPHQGLADGDLKFRLFGQRLTGEWVLVHMKGRDKHTRSGTRENWLLIKHHDEIATDGQGDHLVSTELTSVTTGRTMEQIASGEKPPKPRRTRSTDTQARHPAEMPPSVAAKPTAKSKPTPKPESAKQTRGNKAAALPAFRAPQLATLVDEVPAGRTWQFELKYDGYRCLAAIAGDKVRLYTRNGNDWTDTFGNLVPALTNLTNGTLLLDGEICAMKDGRTDFSALKDALGDGGPLTYFIFDLLEQDGEDLTNLPQLERSQRLDQVLADLPEGSPLIRSVAVHGYGEKVFKNVCAEGLEGVIAKSTDAPYRGDRTRAWLKIKCLKRQEFVVGGWRKSEKKSTFASLLLGTWEEGRLVYRGRVGTGWNESDINELQAELGKRSVKATPFEPAPPKRVTRDASWVRPELVVEVAYTELTPDNYLRHPSFIGVRRDKAARTIALETPVSTGEVTEMAASDPKLDLSDARGIAVAEREGVNLTHPDRVVFPGQGVTKAEIIAYYDLVAPRMLPHLVNRPLSLVRCPEGRSKFCFFQKHASDGFPEQFQLLPIKEKDGAEDDYMYVTGLAGLVAGVQMNALEFHIWGSRIADIERPDRIIFDIDPDVGLDFGDVKQAALDIRARLAGLGLETFPMVTGGKGIHVIAPLAPKAAWPEVKAFCKAFAQGLERDDPARFVANMSKAKRKGRMFVDYLRNERGSTAVAPFSTRSREGAPCAVPVSWDEVPDLTAANQFSLEAAAARAAAPDPWSGYDNLKQAITADKLKAVGAEVED